MSKNSHAMLPCKSDKSNSSVWHDSAGYPHSTPHQAILTDTLNISGCGDYDACVDFVLNICGASLTSGPLSFAKKVEQLTLAQYKPAAELILHWLYEERIIDHNDCLSTAWIDVRGIEMARTGLAPDDCCIPDTMTDAVVALLRHMLSSSDPDKVLATRVFLLGDISRGAHLIIAMLYLWDVFEVSDYDAGALQLTFRGLQLAGMAQRRTGAFPFHQAPAVLVPEGMSA